MSMRCVYIIARFSPVYKLLFCASSSTAYRCNLHVHRAFAATKLESSLRTSCSIGSFKRNNEFLYKEKTQLLHLILYTLTYELTEKRPDVNITSAAIYSLASFLFATNEPLDAWRQRAHVGK